MTIRVTFWQNMPSHHMAPLQRELARLPDYQVRVVFAEDVSLRRRNMGWSRPNLLPAEVVILGGNDTAAKSLARESAGINIFGGFPVGIFAGVFENLPRSAGTWRVLLLEAGDVHGLKGKLRPIYHALRVNLIRKDVDFVLAFGSRGVDYYTKCGFDPKLLYPFLYPNEDTVPSELHPTGSPVRLVYAGLLEKRKGVDLLLRALSQLMHFDWRLEIVGIGQQEARLKTLAERLGLLGRIEWLGPVPSSEMHERLGGHDVCIVPSRNDGWGMLVNEAVAAGLAVITTPRVGAKDIVDSSGAGLVAHAPSTPALKRCLETLLASPNKIDKAKRAAGMIRGQLNGRTAALYLDYIIRQRREAKSGKPLPPWHLSEAAGVK